MFSPSRARWPRGPTGMPPRRITAAPTAAAGNSVWRSVDTPPDQLPAGAFCQDPASGRIYVRLPSDAQEPCPIGRHQKRTPQQALGDYVGRDVQGPAEKYQGRLVTEAVAKALSDEGITEIDVVANVLKCLCGTPTLDRGCPILGVCRDADSHAASRRSRHAVQLRRLQRPRPLRHRRRRARSLCALKIANRQRHMTDAHQDSRNVAAPERTLPVRTAAPWQFSLRGLFLLMTAAAGTAAVASVWGLGSLILSTGFILATLNWRGGCAAVQTNRARPRLFYTAWLLFAASLFLPVTKGCGTDAFCGWQAALVCAGAEVDLLKDIASACRTSPQDSEPRIIEGAGDTVSNRARRTVEAVGSALWVTLLNLANLLMLGSPWLLWRLQRGRGQRLAALLAWSTVAVWLVPLDAPPPMYLSGYYVWCLSFTLVLTTLRITLRLLLTMLGLAAVYVVCTLVT